MQGVYVYSFIRCICNDGVESSKEVCVYSAAQKQELNWVYVYKERKSDNSAAVLIIKTVIYCKFSYCKCCTEE